MPWSSKEEPKLTGDRIDVTSQASALVATPGAEGVEFILPQPVPNENWGQMAGNPAHYLGQLALPEKVTRAWSANIGSGDGRGKALLNQPVVHSGRLFALDTSGEVTALDAKTGNEIWSIELPLKESEQASLGGGLAVIGDLLFVTTGGGQVFALTASTGKAVWDIDLAVPLRAAPTVQGERLFVTSHDNRVFALSALNGALQWTHSGMEEQLGTLTAGAPAAANGLLAVPYTSGEIYVLRSTDGRYVWHDSLSSPFSGQDPESTVSSIAAPPVLADGVLYVTGQNGGLSAYEVTTGQRFWKTSITTSQPMVVAGTVVFVLTDKGELVSVNRRDGSIRWVTDLNSGLPEADERRIWSGPIFAGGRLIAGSDDGYAASINPETGKRTAATELDDGTALPPFVADGGLYFLTKGGKIICFRAEGK